MPKGEYLGRLAALAKAIDTVNEYIGRATAWVALLLVLDQFLVVVLRYVFNVGFLMMQESIVYLHGILFMFAAGYTLLHNAHVRVDIFYRESTPKGKALVDLAGVLFFLMPLCLLTWLVSWSYVINSWRVLEGSMELSGLPLMFLLKTVIWVFLALLMAQGISTALKSLFILAGVEIPETAEKSVGAEKEG